jgi:glycine/D-amino acid oxidase-like deaminating enzyme
LLAGVNVPLYSAEHFYLVTGKIDGIHPLWPVVRDPDGFIYYKEEVGGLVMGGFEPVAKPWRVDPIPATFQFQLLGEDWDQFEVLMRSALGLLTYFSGMECPKYFNKNAMREVPITPSQSAFMCAASIRRQLQEVRLR